MFLMFIFLVDWLAKQAAVEDGPFVFDKTPREVIVTREKENVIQMWQQQWLDAGKGVVTRTFFRSVRNKLQQIFPYSKSLQQ
jgi:hypothetical protein